MAFLKNRILKIRKRLISESVIDIEAPIVDCEREVNEVIQTIFVVYVAVSFFAAMAFFFAIAKHMIDANQIPLYFGVGNFIFWFLVLVYIFNGFSNDIAESLKKSSSAYVAERDKRAKAKQELRMRNQMEANERRRLEEERLKDAEQKRKRYLQDLEDEEAAKSRGNAKGLEELFGVQIELMIKYKKEGVNIENDIYEMRKRLLSLERGENKAMVQDLLQTLDGL